MGIVVFRKILLGCTIAVVMGLSSLAALTYIVYRMNGPESEEDYWVKFMSGSKDDVGYHSIPTSDGGAVVLAYTESNDDIFTGMIKGGAGTVLVKLNSSFGIQWKASVSGSAGDKGTEVATSPDGGFVVIGHTNDADRIPTAANSNNQDVLLVKIDKHGKTVWRKTYGGSKDDGGSSITPTVGGYLITGSTNSDDGDFTGLHNGESDAFVMMIDNNGEVVWKNVFGGSGDENICSGVITADKHILVAGTTTSNDGAFKKANMSGKDSNAVFVMKLTKNGRIVWNKTFGGSGTDVAEDIALGMYGTVIVAGWSNSKDGDFGMNLEGQENIFVLKLDTDGTIVWNRILGGNGDNGCASIAATSDGGVVLTGHSDFAHGSFPGTYGHGGWLDYWDVLVVKLDSYGVVEWTEGIGGTGMENGHSIEVMPNNELLLSGWTSSSGDDFSRSKPGSDDDMSYDVFVTILTSDGQIKSR